MLEPAVLLVDDDQSVREFVAYTLRDKGYRVIEAKDGVEALRAAAHYAGPIPMLLTDLAMPGLNGVELARRIRSQRPETKIAYITAYPHLSESDRSPILRKPFTPEELLSRVRAMFPKT